MLSLTLVWDALESGARFTSLDGKTFSSSIADLALDLHFGDFLSDCSAFSCWGSEHAISEKLLYVIVISIKRFQLNNWPIQFLYWKVRNTWADKYLPWRKEENEAFLCIFLWYCTDSSSQCGGNVIPHSSHRVSELLAFPTSSETVNTKSVRSANPWLLRKNIKA